MNIEIKSVNKIAIVKPSDKIDLYNAVSLKTAINDLIIEDKIFVIMNLEKVFFIDSSGLGVFITTMLELKKIGGFLIITGLNGFVRKTFNITNSMSLFEIYETESEALKSVYDKKNISYQPWL